MRKLQVETVKRTKTVKNQTKTVPPLHQPVTDTVIELHQTITEEAHHHLHHYRQEVRHLICQALIFLDCHLRIIQVWQLA